MGDSEALSELVRAAHQEGAAPAEIASALGVSVGVVREALDTPPTEAPSDEALAEGEPTAPAKFTAAEVVRQQIERAERAVSAAEAAGDTSGARVWAGIVSRLVPLLVRVDEAKKGDGVTLTRSDIATAGGSVRERVRLALREEGAR